MIPLKPITDTNFTAYMRSLSIEEIAELTPQIDLHSIPYLARSELYVLMHEDGYPLILSNSKDALLLNAMDQDISISAIH